jgi:anti-anti-sigma regulatory factor
MGTHLSIFDRHVMGEEGLQIQFQIGHLRSAVPLVLVSGPLNEVTAEHVQRHLDGRLDGSPWAVVLDLTSVSSIGRGAVPSLVAIARRAGRTDVGFRLVCAPSADVAAPPGQDSGMGRGVGTGLGLSGRFTSPTRAA